MSANKNEHYHLEITRRAMHSALGIVQGQGREGLKENGKKKLRGTPLCAAETCMVVRGL